MIRFQCQHSKGLGKIVYIPNGTVANIGIFIHVFQSGFGLVCCGLTSHSAIFQLYSNGTIVHFSNCCHAPIAMGR